MNINSNLLGEFITEKRESLGLTLNQLSDKTGISHSYLFRLEKGERKNPTIETISSICSVLNIDIYECMEHAGLKPVCAYGKLNKKDFKTLISLQKLNKEDKKVIQTIINTIITKGISNSAIKSFMIALNSDD